MSFSEKRKSANLTMAQAAEILDVTPAAICQWETGKTMPKAEKLPEIAKAYGCTIDDLMKEDT